MPKSKEKYLKVTEKIQNEKKIYKRISNKTIGSLEMPLSVSSFK